MRPQFAQLGALAVTGVDVGELVVDQSQVQASDLVALNQYRRGLALMAGGEYGQALGFPGHRGACLDDVVGCGGVLLADRALLVDALDQVSEAVRLKDHRDDVRRRRLIRGHHLGDKHLPVVGEPPPPAKPGVRARRVVESAADPSRPCS